MKGQWKGGTEEASFWNKWQTQGERLYPNSAQPPHSGDGQEDTGRGVIFSLEHKVILWE